MAETPPFDFPTAAAFKAYFTRDFPFGTDQEKQIIDSDIERALKEAKISFAFDRYLEKKDDFDFAALYLAAHFLVSNIQASNVGLQSKGWFIDSTSSSGDISTASEIPDRIKQSPVLSSFCTTSYGLRFSIFIYPKTIGQIVVM